MSKYCAIVKDLVWQYAEGECLPETKEFIEEHISECEDCRKLFNSIKKVDELMEKTVVADPIADEKILKKGFRKIRKHFIATTVTLILIIPLVLSLVLVRNEINNRGVCFSNIDEIKVARDFAYCLEKGEYADAAKYLDFSRDYRKMVNAKEHLGKTWYNDAVIIDKTDDVYAISGNLAKRLERDGYTEWRTSFNENQFWSVVMTKYPEDAFIPEHIWNGLVTDSYEMAHIEKNAVIPLKINGVECERMLFFYRHETEYGVYYSANSAPIGADITLNAPMIIGLSAVVNKEIYDDARAYIEDNAENAMENFLEFHENELKMTCEEYNEYRREDFANRMELYNERGYKFVYHKMKDAYKRNVWVVEISCVEKGNEVEIKYTIDLHIAGGKIIKMNSLPGTNYLFDEILVRARMEK